MKKIRYFLRINYKFLLLGFFASLASYVLWQKEGYQFLRHYHLNNRQIGVVGNYTLDTLPDNIRQLISFGLTTLDKSGNPHPGAATKWEIDSTGTRYTFFLRRDLHWHDGKKFVAQDINYILKPAKMQVVNNYQIRFTLPEPFAPFLVAVSRPLWRRRIVGLGEYKIRKLRFRRGDIINILVLENKQGQKIVFHFYPTQEDLRNAFLLGEIHEAWGLKNVAFFRKYPHLLISPEHGLVKEYVAVFFNLAKPPLDNKRVRQALAYTIPKPVGEKRALTPISPFSWAYNHNVKTYNYNLNHAQAILKKAKTGKFSLTLWTLADLLKTAEVIQNKWQQLGVTTKIKVVSGVTPQDDFDAFLGYGYIPPDPDQYYFWHSHQPGNITHYQNIRIDTLLENGRRTLVKAERKQIYADFQRFLVEDTPAVFLFYPETYNLRRQPVFRI